MSMLHVYLISKKRGSTFSKCILELNRAEVLSQQKSREYQPLQLGFKQLMKRLKFIFLGQSLTVTVKRELYYGGLHNAYFIISQQVTIRRELSAHGGGNSKQAVRQATLKAVKYKTTPTSVCSLQLYAYCFSVWVLYNEVQTVYSAYSHIDLGHVHTTYYISCLLCPNQFMLHLHFLELVLPYFMMALFLNFSLHL